VGIRKAYSGNQYGRCVFACDNNVVDHQAVMMSFENGVECTLTMTGFTKEAGRRIVFHGTYGEIELLDDVEKIKVSVYGKDTVTIDIKDLVDVTDEFSHGGGDDKLIDCFYGVLTDTIKAETGLVQSVESHLIALAAEESRKSGEVIKLHK
jgi:predicted dehydrogenase